MKQFRRLYIWLSSGLLMFLAGCVPGNKQTVVVRTLRESTLTVQGHIAPKKHAHNVRTITIWVHGSKGSCRMMPISAVKNFFDCKPGLHHWSETSPKSHIRKIASILTQNDPERFAQEDFYLFGWSGLLSFQAREQAAGQLHRALIDLLAHYQNDTALMPAVRIITHSHGGNVALLLAEVMEKSKQYFSIDTLILLACPVQDRTAHLVESRAFKKIYSLYSEGDLFQIGDPQGAYKEVESQSFFSRRHFQAHNHLRQIIVRFNGRSLAHVEFILTRFLKLLPAMLDVVDDWYQDMGTYVHEPHTIDLVLNIKK